jgi:hypothetical protein
VHNIVASVNSEKVVKRSGGIAIAAMIMAIAPAALENICAKKRGCAVTFVATLLKTVTSAIHLITTDVGTHRLRIDAM